ncbi:hypothetical protein V3481_010086 [Fusarium oxysporum f. sp. vasinfectum]
MLYQEIAHGEADIRIWRVGPLFIRGNGRRSQEATDLLAEQKVEPAYVSGFSHSERNYCRLPRLQVDKVRPPSLRVFKLVRQGKLQELLQLLQGGQALYEITTNVVYHCCHIPRISQRCVSFCWMRGSTSIMWHFKTTVVHCKSTCRELALALSCFRIASAIQDCNTRERAPAAQHSQTDANSWG